MSRRSGECRSLALLLSVIVGILLLLVACQRTDTTPPTVNLTSISSPVTSATTLTLEANASDDTAVTSVEFLQRHTPALLGPQQTWTLIGEDAVWPYQQAVDVTSAHNGTLEFRATAHDAAGHSADDTVSVTVTIPGVPGNQPPRFLTEAITGAAVGVPYSYAVTTSDPDAGDTLTITAPTKPAWLTLTDNGGGSATLAGTPGDAEVGDHQVELRVTDSFSAAATQAFQVTVTNTNDPPAFTGILADETLIRNTITPKSVGVSIGVTDPEGDTLTVTATSSNQELVADSVLNPSCVAGTCTLTFTPAADETASTVITLEVSDGFATASTGFTVFVVPRLVLNTDNGGFGSLREAIQTAVAGDVIGFDIDGGFATPQTIPLLFQLVIDKSLTIEGTPNIGVTLDGGGAVRIAEVTNGATVRVVDVAFVNGNAPICGSGIESCGGGLLVDSGTSLILEHCQLSNNRADFGGGAIVVSGSLRLVRSEVSGNVAIGLGGGILNANGLLVIEASLVSANHAVIPTSAGGGILTTDSGATVLRSSLVDGNTAGKYGGGLAGVSADVEIIDTTISSNSAGESGGGIYNDQGKVELQASEVASNAAQEGGGIYNLSGTVEVLGQSSVQGNTADFGGGIYSRQLATFALPTVTIDNSTIGGSDAGDGNTVSNSGGGIFTQDGTLTIRNASSVDGNSGDDGGGIFIGSGTVTIEDSGVSGNSAHDGGGIFNDGGTAKLDNSAISGNTADDDGGGIYNSSGSLDLVSSLVGGRNLATGNRADNHGGGIYTDAPLRLGDCSVIAYNTADADQTGSQGGGYYKTNTAALTIDLSCVPYISDNIPDDFYHQP